MTITACSSLKMSKATLINRIPVYAGSVTTEILGGDKLVVGNVDGVGGGQNTLRFTKLFCDKHMILNIYTGLKCRSHVIIHNLS